ncbi:DEAD/DEAH box helicase family protein [Bacillaceae bacterium]
MNSGKNFAKDYLCEVKDEQGEINTENLIQELIPLIEKARSIYMIVSFAMESGVRLIQPSLRRAAERGADIKILTGDYLYVTQPEALRRLILIHPAIEVRLWKSNGVSFHPKTFLFQEENSDGILIVGSSNLSQSALTYGIEWNLLVESAAEPFIFQKALDLFMQTFYHACTIPVNRETLVLYEKEYSSFYRKHPDLRQKWTEQEEKDLMYSAFAPFASAGASGGDGEKREAYLAQQPVTPRPAQAEALEELQKTIEEGYDKAMVVMATGLGKTYLAGFFAKKYRRVLFIAHREEILLQARQTFQRIMPDRSMGIFNGNAKDANADVIFASIFTLGIKHHLNSFSPDYFDLIIIDEFHHAAAPSYWRVIEYFSPAFLLGITATPDRLDGKDVYALCDGNVAYRVHFIEAIQRGWLAPFRYYGVYDDTDYSWLTWLGNRYEEGELLAVQLREEMAKKIFQAWKKYKQTRTLGFCSSIRQADYLADYFKKQGVSALGLHSKTVEMGRNMAIQHLEAGKLEVIFTVDLFNEGVDIPSVDTLLFVRPTESLTVFTQQIGRGLRLHPDKPFCTIIDLIGNYRNVDIKLSLFDTEAGNKERKDKRMPVSPKVPANCELHLDLQAVNLLQEMARISQPRKEKLRAAYLQLKQELGHRPAYLEMHLRGKVNAREFAQEFGSYFGFLSWAGELNEQENEVYQRYKDWFWEAEKTGMAKSYKMIVLLYMLNRGHDRWWHPVTPQEVAPFFYAYLTEKEYRKRIDFSDKSSRELWKFDLEKVSR